MNKCMYILRSCYNNKIQTNIEDQDKMLQYVAFYQGLHYLLRLNILIIVSNQTSYYFFFKFHAVANL